MINILFPEILPKLKENAYRISQNPLIFLNTVFSLKWYCNIDDVMQLIFTLISIRSADPTTASGLENCSVIFE